MRAQFTYKGGGLARHGLRRAPGEALRVGVQEGVSIFVLVGAKAACAWDVWADGTSGSAHSTAVSAHAAWSRQ